MQIVSLREEEVSTPGHEDARGKRRGMIRLELVTVYLSKEEGSDRAFCEGFGPVFGVATGNCSLSLI